MTSSPLIATKFHIPPARTDFVLRPRLRAMLETGSRAALTLVSAPPGFGKSTLVADWVHSRAGIQLAWLSLDESDDQPALFWRYFIAALQGLCAGLGETAQTMLTAPQPPELETILATLINELAATDGQLTLVVDDYHLIRSSNIHNSLNFFLDHQPANFHLMLLTREDPPLNLARRRARRQMTEIRAADLRFDNDEAAAFLNATMGLTLTPEQVAALERRTEGWIVGLQMAALSMRGSDPQAFFDSFTGDDRYIADYLIEEVLNHQSEPVRDFLLRTSVLEKLSAPLCEAMLGKTSVELVELERANLFLVPLDNTRVWYRYHHLFADLLRQCLRETVSAEEVAGLYRAASGWCEANGDIHAAIRYARHIPDEVRVALLLQQYAGLFFARNELVQLTDYARALPASLLEKNPHRCMAVVWAMIGTRQPADFLLAYIEQHFGMSAEAALTDDSLDNARRAALLEALVVRQQSVFENPTIRSRERLLAIQTRLAQLPDDTPCLFNTVGSLRPVIVYGLGFDTTYAGDVRLAAQYLEEAIVLSRQNNNQHLVQISAALLASVQLMQGGLHAAHRTHTQALSESSQDISPYAAQAHAGLGEILYEWGEIEKAEHHFQKALPLARAWNQWNALFTIVTGLARISKRRGDSQTALSLLDDFRPQNDNLLTQTEALRLAWMGDPASSLTWLGLHNLSASSTPTPFNESLLLNVTRMFISMNRMDDALILSRKVLESAKAGGRNHYVIQADILLSKIHAAQGKTQDALTRLNEALQLAEPEKHLSTFVDEGDTIRALLMKMTGNASAQRVLAGFALGADSLEKQNQPSAGYEALSEREREVLWLIAEGCSNQDIASRLVISITTVKTHVGNIFNKLGVTSRTQAIARAESLGLLPRH